MLITYREHASMKILVAVFVAVLTVAASAQEAYEAVITGWLCRFEPAEAAAEFFPYYHLTMHGASAAAAAPGGRVFAAMHRDATLDRGVHVAEIRPGEPPVPVSDTIPDYEPLALSVSSQGRMYVLAQPLPSGPDVLLTFDAQGNAGPFHVLGEGFAFPAPGAMGAMELAADQCTVFLIQNENLIRRLNVCTGAFLPDFAAATPGSSSLRILPDGGLLVGRMTATDRYDAAGTLVRTYPVQGAGGIGLTYGGARAWIAPRCSSPPFELDLATGERTNLTEGDRVAVLSVVPYRGWTAALGAHLGQSIPTINELGFAALALVLTLAAFLRLR